MPDLPEKRGPAELSSTTSPTSLLLVDDNPANLLSLRALLDQLGYRLVEAQSGEEALEKARDEEFAAILLDVLMPGMSGFETAKQLRHLERSRHTPIIFLTAHDVERTQLEEAYTLGAVDFLVKPLVPVILQAKVRSFADIYEDKRHARQEAEQLRLLVQTTIDYAIFLLDPQGHIVSWNPGAQRLKGYRAEEIIGRHFSQFYTEDAIRRRWPEHELEVASRVGRFEDEGWRLRKDGTRFWANVVITALYDGDRNLRGFSKITRDMTERKRAEENARRLVEETTARRVAEENAQIIQEQRERLRVTLASIGDAVISTDHEGRVEFLNNVAQELVGWNNDEAVTRSLSEVFHIVNEDTRRPVDNPALRALREGNIVGLANHTVLISKHGSERPIDDSAAPIRDTAGNVIGSVLVFRDISERRQQEERLREQQEWLRVTLESIGDAVIATDIQGRVTLLNPVAESLTGWTNKEASGRPLTTVFDILNEQTGEPIENPVTKVLREGAIVGLGNHSVLRAKDGTHRPIDDSAAPIRDAKGEMIGVVLTFRDVTEHRRADEELRASEARKSAILETALDCIVTIDHEGRVIEFNPAAESTFGYRRQEMLGKRLDQLIVPAGPLHHDRDGIERFLATGEGNVLGRRFELPALRADGTEFPIELSVTRIQTAGSPLYTAYLRDISEEKKAEQYRNLRLKVAQCLSEARDFQEGAQTVLQAICENLNWELGLYWSANKSGALEALVSWRLPNSSVESFEAVSRQRTFAMNEGLPGRVWTSGKPIWLRDVVRDPNFPRAPFAEQVGLHSAFAFPIAAGDQTIGLIEFFSRQFQESDAALIETLGTIAAHVGQFLERRRAEEGLRQQTATAETLHRIGSLLAAELDLQRLVQIVTDEGTKLSGAQFGAFFYNVTGERGESYMLYTLSGVPRSAFERFPMPRNTGMFGPTFRGEGVVRLDDVTQDPRYGKNSPYYGMPEGHLPVRSYLAVPVLSRNGDVLGGMFFGHAEPGVFNEHHERLLTGIAAQAAVAIDNAMLYQKAQSTAERLNLAIAAADLGDWSWEVATDRVTLSERSAEVFGIDPSPETTWSQMLGMLHEADRELARAEVQRAISEDVPYDIEYRFNRPDGRQIWISALGRATRDSSGTVVGMYGVVKDITDRKRLEEALQASQDLYRAIGESIDYGVWVCDPQGRNIYVSDSFLRLVGLTQQQCSEFGWSTVLHPDDVERTLQSWKECVRTGCTWDIEHRFKGIDGQWHYVLARGVPVRNENGEITAWAGINLDIQRLKQVEEELREADRRKDEFLATLAHELRNPLAPIRNALQILRMPQVDSATSQQTREIMERQVQHLVRLVDDLLDVSRVMRGKIELRREPVELATIVARAVETAQPLIDFQGHQLDLELPRESLLVDVDPIRLAQVVSNLLTNSAKYTERNGRIWLSGQRVGNEAVLRVRDNGIGIASEMLPQVFELFVQADHSATKAQGGLGIGLTLVKSLVEMHGGSVEAYSPGLGHGSEFVVRLPLMQVATPAVTSNSNDASFRAVPSGYRLLVVDDNQDAAISLSLLLQMQGHDIQVAHDGPTALELAADFKPAMVFLDIGMPVMDGFEVARRMRGMAGLEGTVLVALTGWGQKEDRRRTAEAGFDHHLVKPPEPKALEILLEKLRRK